MAKEIVQKNLNCLDTESYDELIEMLDDAGYEMDPEMLESKS